MSSGLGDLEQLVLLAVMRLGERAYAVGVKNEIESRTERSISRGAVYTTLDRLERKGFLSSSMAEPTAERGGKAKRVFRLEASGAQALQSSLDGIAGLLDGVSGPVAWNPAP